MSQSGARATRSVVYFEIGSGSVAAVCGVANNENFVLHWSKRIYLPLIHETDYDQFMKVTLSTLMDLAMTLMSEGVPAAKREAGFDPKHATCHVFLGAPWYVATTRTATKKQEQPFRVTKDMVREYVERDMLSVTKAVQAANKNPLLQEPVALETLTLAAHLNGYPVRQYVGKECTTFSLTTYYSMTAERVKENIEQVLSRVLPNFAHALSSTALAHYHTMRMVDPYARNTALVEIGAEITNVSAVRDDVLTQCMTFAIGTNHLLRQIAHKDARRDEALSKAVQLLGGANAELQLESLDPALVEGVDAWRSEFIETIDTLVQGEPWPHSIALVVNEPWPQLFRSALGTYWQHDTFGAVEPIRTVPLTNTAHAIETSNHSVRKDARLVLLGQALMHQQHVYRTESL